MKHIPVEWELVRHFSADEFRCPCGCERAAMDKIFVGDLDDMRETLDFPIFITSGYRCPEYNNRISSTGREGPHTTGMAADIGVSYHRARALLGVAVPTFQGIGLKQHGAAAGRFMHVDACGRRTWTYP